MKPGEYDAIKKDLRKNSKNGIALDIDETLSWTIGYWVENLQKKFGNPESLSVTEMITKYRYTQNVPYWQTEEAMAWMEENRNSNEVQEILPLIENSNAIVQKINLLVPIVMYITTRPAVTIPGTVKWLRKHNFPDVEIIARPDSVHLTEGNKWKAQVLEQLYPNVEGIIDDNPGLVNNLSENYKGVVYLYDNAQHPRKDLDVVACKTWNVVYEKVRERYARG